MVAYLFFIGLLNWTLAISLWSLVFKDKRPNAKV